LSSLPGRRRAGSIRSGLLVAARMYTPFRPSTPSNWVSSWFTTRSVTPVLSCPRRGARESNSSKKRMQDIKAYRVNISLTACSLAPIYLLSNSGPLILMKLSPHSLATTPASSVLPVPGGP
ncbi:predicted protein, partial [Nematostella vectensis]